MYKYKVNQLIEELNNAVDNNDKTTCNLIKYKLCYLLNENFDEISTEESLELLTVIGIHPLMVTSVDNFFLYKDMPYEEEIGSIVIDPSSGNWFESPREALQTFIEEVYGRLSAKVN